MTRTTTTITLSIAAGITAAITMYGAFTAGFMIAAVQYPQFDGKTVTEGASVLHVDTTATTNAEQAYDDSSYYLQPTVSPYNTNTTQLVNEYTPTIQQLIIQANTHKLPDWVK